MTAAPIEVVAGAVVIIAAALIRSYRNPNGLLRRAINDHDSASEAHEAIPEIMETLDRVESGMEENRETLCRVDERTGETARIMFLLHKDDCELDTEEVRERLDIDELDDDIYDSGV